MRALDWPAPNEGGGDQSPVERKMKTGLVLDHDWCACKYGCITDILVSLFTLIHLHKVYYSAG